MEHNRPPPHHHHHHQQQQQQQFDPNLNLLHNLAFYSNNPNYNPNLNLNHNIPVQQQQQYPNFPFHPTPAPFQQHFPPFQQQQQQQQQPQQQLQLLQQQQQQQQQQLQLLQQQQQLQQLQQQQQPQPQPQPQHQPQPPPQPQHQHQPQPPPQPQHQPQPQLQPQPQKQPQLQPQPQPQKQPQRRQSESIKIQPKPTFPIQRKNNNNPSVLSGERKHTLEAIQAAVTAARRQAIESGENVNISKVSQSVLLKLQASSWDSLGFQLHEVPTLHQLVLLESKVNMFIRCHVAAQKITTLFDLQEALCKNKSVEKFEDLELGPFLQHPLVRHYFSLTNDVEEVYKITSDQVVSQLSLFLYRSRNVVIDEFLEFVAKKQKVTDPRVLGLRIQSLGMHVGFLHKARNAQDLVLKKAMEVVKEKSNKRRKKRPLFSLQKQELDNRFSAISERVTSFASVRKDFCGKHTRFVSSSSDEFEGMTDSSDDEIENGCLTSNQDQPSSVKGKSGDKVSGCPYPSVAEEMTRLGLKGENGESSSPCTPSKSQMKSERREKRRKLNSLLARSTKSEDENNIDNADVHEAVRMFITTWKESCRSHSAKKVLDKMLIFYEGKSKRRRLREAFSVYPLLGLLYVGVTSIKKGMWDSMYDTFEIMGELGQTDSQANKLEEHERIDVEHIDIDPKISSKPTLCVNLEDIVRKASDYLAQHTVVSAGSQLVDRAIMFAKGLSLCEVWLAEQFSVNDFNLLGHGDFFSFLERNSSLIPKELLNFVRGEVQEKQSLEVRMVQQQLVMLLCQASSSLWEGDVVTKEKIMELLVRQFPLLSFKIVENGSIQEILDFVGKQKGSVASNCVIFSATLFGTSKYVDSVGSTVSAMLDDSLLMEDMEKIDGNFRSITSKDAINNLLKAPFLSDLNTWSHWDLLYGPSLGPLLEWLLNEVNVEGLLCLLTRDGKIIRVDHSASADLFLQALLQESPFQMAVQLLSFFAVSGGKTHVPLSFLKCQARQGFEVIMGKYMQNMDSNGGSENRLSGSEHMGFHSSMSLVRNSNGDHNAITLVSRIVIDCLVLLPSEFRCFAADVLLTGLQSLVKDVASEFLGQCKGNGERIMLHEIGFSLGIIEWVHDHNSVCPMADSNTLISTGVQSPTSMGSNVEGLESSQYPSNETTPAVSKDDLCRDYTKASISLGISENGRSEYDSHHLAEEGIEEAALIVESIRHDEFGLDPNLSDGENKLLKKQHARLGRALHCLSEELYSQDSHFLLELVQNADDNVYPANVEPMLSFVLLDTGITVLNNERGFTAKNIRALCDVGNSTKKGSSAGYIGQKGIGFKSVFRVTDAPEIHSNGFHIKFDIGQGQIGFVLPTLIPPCDIEMLKRLLPEDDSQKGLNSWNTCIVLPFKSKLLEGSGMSSILSMFSDLHPSLLLFLHRLRCIKLRNMLDGSLIVMRKEVVGDGIVKVSHGKEKLTWFVASNKLHPKVFRSNVHMTEISIAFTLNESLNGDYEPFLNQQPVFAFLPLRTYGLKFILQADFILPSSREEVDGDSPWNQWLLSEFPALFVSAEKSFCSLPCFRDNPAKAVSAYMSFVPLMGEVHGFFSALPRMIIAKLRQSNCLPQDGCEDKWVPPCKVLRRWNEQVHMLLPDTLLYKHLGLVLLHKDVNLSDPLAQALGVEDYGPKILVQFISSLGRTKDGIKSMGLYWLFLWLNELHNMSNSYAPNCRDSGLELDLLNSLKKVPFIPLSDGTHGSLDDGTIWFHADYISIGLDGELGNEAFPCLYATLRIVNPVLFSQASTDVNMLNNCTRMLQKIGVQQISAHELIRIHILPSISNDRLTDESKQLMREYITFIMLHLHSNCVECHVESEHIISELSSKALILTNHGYVRPAEVPIHFGEEYGNSFDANKLTNGLEYKWHEVDAIYLKHPTIESGPGWLMKWREFLLKLGVSDFVKVVPIEKMVADLSPTVRNQIMCDVNLISPELVVKDWESPELVHLLSLLSEDGNQERCKYLLESLDYLWDDHFGDKVFGSCSSNSGLKDLSFKSSLWHCISEFRWVSSSVDNDLHYPRELFYDSDIVCSILGSHAPYAVPKVKNEKLLTAIGFKTHVTLDDALAMLQSWRTMGGTFTASLSQMSKFYSFIWKEMVACRQQVLEALNSGPSIFIPCASVKIYEDVLAGVFLFPDEVYWHDSTGALDHRRNDEFPFKTNCVPLSQTLCSIYPGLHDFFVNECGVHEVPSFRHYCQILQQLSGKSSALQAANAVFQIFLKWSDDLKCGALTSDDVAYLKECLLQSEFRVLPALQDKWVSLHPSFGLVCWSDDDVLKKEFKHSDNIEFLYFGELTDNDKEMLQTKVSVLLQNLGIPTLSKVVSREAIYYGPTDCGFKISMVVWVLPYAQRYLYNLHPERYGHLKQSGCELQHLRIFVVEQLFYRNVIKRCNCSSKKRTECNSLLQGNILFTTRESESHSMFMELSRLFFDGVPELHLANFLHMIITMAESGSTEEQMEFFILNSQKMVKLPIEESLWSISSSLENDQLTRNALSTNINDQKSKKKSGYSWPPVDWKTAPGFNYAREHGLWKQPVDMDLTGSNTARAEGLLESSVQGEDEVMPLTEINEDVIIEDDGVVEPDSTTIPHFKDQTDLSQPMEVLTDPTHIVVECLNPDEGQSRSKDQSSTPGAQVAMRTGRLGELVAFRYFTGKGKGGAEGAEVKWVNQDEETGLPYDIVIGGEENREYIEVKASRYAKKDWFAISTREWQFAAEKGDSFSIAHVLLSGKSLAKIIVYKNPVKLCQLGKLQLTVMIPRS